MYLLTSLKLFQIILQNVQINVCIIEVNKRDFEVEIKALLIINPCRNNLPFHPQSGFYNHSSKLLTNKYFTLLRKCVLFLKNFIKK